MTLAATVEQHARFDDASVYEVDVPALVDLFRGLGPVRLLAVIDLAERTDAAVRRGDFHGRERVRRRPGSPFSAVTRACRPALDVKPPAREDPAGT